MRVWSHAVMLLLGITLTVGFYEGRRLVTNTMRALQIGEPSSGLAARLEPDAPEGGARREEKRLRATPRPGRQGSSTALPLAPDARQSSSRSRHRSRPGEPGVPLDRLDAMRPDAERPLAVPAQPAAQDTGEPLP